MAGNYDNKNDWGMALPQGVITVWWMTTKDTKKYTQGLGKAKIEFNTDSTAWARKVTVLIRIINRANIYLVISICEALWSVLYKWSNSFKPYEAKVVLILLYEETDREKG